MAEARTSRAGGAWELIARTCAGERVKVLDDGCESAATVCAYGVAYLHRCLPCRNVFFDSWSDLLRIVVVGTLAYAGLIVMLRVSGKRSLSQLNAFDFVVTVALGSVLATVLLSRDIVLAEGLLAFALLLGLQYVITWSSVRSSTVRRLVKADPTLLVHRGRFLDQAMQATRVTEDEVLSAARKAGIASLQDLGAVVLETDGTLSVLSEHPPPEHSTLPPP